MAETPKVGDIARSIQIGPDSVPVTDPFLVHPSVAEVFVDLRIVDGWVAISLGAYSQEAGPAEVRITHRIRVPLSLMANMQTAIEMQTASLAQAKQQAN